MRGKCLKVLDGASRPEETDADGVASWETANNIYSILVFFTEGSSYITVRAHESTEQGCLGDGVAARKSLKERFDGNTKGARRSCREKHSTSAMRAGRDPTSSQRWMTFVCVSRTWGRRFSIIRTLICSLTLSRSSSNSSSKCTTENSRSPWTKSRKQALIFTLTS